MKTKTNKISHIGHYSSGEFQHIHEYEEIGDQYQCPMNCEGNKTYEQPGNCPVCNMRLVLIK